MKELGLDPTQLYDAMEPRSRDGHFWLAGELSNWRMKEDKQTTGGLLFVINTISDIEPVERGIQICGICSPFVRSQ